MSSTKNSTTEAPQDGLIHPEEKTAGETMDLLRFTTAGSVDDGKSTLIGRLLFDSKSIFEDQLDALEQTAVNRGEAVNLALLTDGLRAEREQGITIDVAYRYFATPRRKFIIADTPGHEQYTRNMVTGASTADLAIILIDARKGVLTQSRRHAFISSLLQIPRLVLAVNKMDLVDYSRDRFEEIVEEFRTFSKHLDVEEVTSIPISALKGDNIVNSSESMPWYDGPTLLHHLEHVRVDARKTQGGFRFPVQYVIRPDQDYRGFAGRVVSGSVQRNDEVMLLPAGQKTTIKAIDTPDGPVGQASTGDSVILRLGDEMDLSRGDMIVHGHHPPAVTTRFEADLCWMNGTALQIGRNYVLMHTTNTTAAVVRAVHHRIDVDSLSRDPASTLALNEIGRISIETARPVFVDPYRKNSATGSFILVDPETNVTAAAGMIRAETAAKRDSAQSAESAIKSPNTFWDPWNIGREEREKRNGHRARVIWLTGVSGAGKTTIGRALERKLWDAGIKTMLLDGDQVRHGLNGDLGFSTADRTENIRRAAEVARLFYEHGNVVICSFVSPNRRDRSRAASLFPDGAFTEVHLHCDPETRQQRDPKGLYRKAREGKIKSLTGYDAEYELSGPETLSIKTDRIGVDEAVAQIMKRVFKDNI